MATIEVEKGTEWHVRRQISNTLTDHDNRIAALEGGGGGGGTKIPPGITFDGTPDAILVGSQGRCTVKQACTITGWTILADRVGSCVIDIWREPYSAYPPTVADTITGSAKPTLTSANKATSTTLTGWTTALNAGDTLIWNVDSATTVQQILIELSIS